MDPLRLSLSRLWVCCLFLLLGLSPLQAWATIYHVTTSGGGTACTDLAPCGNIMTGIGKLTAGDTLYIHGGTYSQSIKTSLGTIPSGTSWSAPVTIQAAPNETVTLAASPAIDLNSTTTTVQFVIFDGLNIDAAGGTSEGMFCGGTTIHDLKFRNMEVKNSGNTGIAMHPNTQSSTGSCANIEFAFMHVHHNGSNYTVPGGSVPADHGFYTNAQHLIIRDSEINHNFGLGIQIYGTDIPNNSHNTQVYNNYIHHNSTGGPIGGITGGPGNNIHIYNNIIAQNNGGGITPWTYGNPQNTQIDHNLFYANTGWAIEIQAGPTDTLVRNNVFLSNTLLVSNSGTRTSFTNNMCDSGAPAVCAVFGTASYVAEASGNFHLNAGSEGIDDGPTLSNVLTDKDGVSRPQGTSADLGPYERLAATPGSCTSACTVFVSPFGSDAQSCDTADSVHPRQTVAGGVACLTQPGSTLNLRAGTYAAAVDTSVTPIAGGTSWSAPTTIQAYNGEAVTLQLPSGSFVALLFANPATDHYILVKDLQVDAQDRADSNAIGIVPGAHHLRFQNVQAHDSFFEPFYSEGASNIEILSSTFFNAGTFACLRIAGTSANVLVQDTVLSQCGGPGLLADGNAAPSGTITNLTVRSVAIHDAGQATSTYGLVLGGGGHTGTTVINSRLWQNYGGLRVQTGASTLTLANNTLYGNSQNGIQVDTGASAITLTNTISANNGGNAHVDTCGCTTQQANLTTAPGFVDAAAGNFRLTNLALTAIDHGTPVAAVTDDPDGTLRPQGTAYDIGAYEFVGIPGAPNPVLTAPLWSTRGFFR